MLDFTIKTTKLDLSLDVPDRKFWLQVATDANKEIHKRTVKGQEVEGGSFAPYSKAYAKKRAKGGRSAKPNLTWSGRMLSSISVKAGKDYGKLSLTGREGLKAWANEQMGRDFFDISQKQLTDIVKKASAWMKRRNDLK
jgi:hypothetical protein